MAATTPTLTGFAMMDQVRQGANALFRVRVQLGASPAVETTRAADGSALTTWAAAYTRISTLYDAAVITNDTTQ